ncbi:TPA: Ubiquitin-like protein 7-like [Bos taurus]|nr:TPA: Ubiquitin-like protein 7-like [Bos taurus]
MTHHDQTAGSPSQSVAGEWGGGCNSSSQDKPSSAYQDMPGGFLFEGLSDDEDDFHPSARSMPSSSTPSSRPASLGYSGAAEPRPITQSELATALALVSTPERGMERGWEGHSSGTSPMSSSVQSGTPITNDLFSQALQHALQASGQPSLQEQLGRGSVTGEGAPSKGGCPCSFHSCTQCPWPGSTDHLA